MKPKRRYQHGSPATRAQRGYVLVMVLGVIALIALLAGRLALRVDVLREQTISLADYVRGQLQATSALQAGLYWTTTRPLGRGGFGDFPDPELRADGRTYLLFGGVELRLQDLRGLYPLNASNRDSLARLLLQLGAKSDAVDGLIDVLLDYQDTDSLKRLNGAEADEYAALGLPPPRNDWLLSVSELQHLPGWREQPELVRKLIRQASTNRDGFINPNTMSKELLLALQPYAKPEQIELFFTLRRMAPFDSAAAMKAATGLQFQSDDYMFHISDRMRFSIWAPGMPYALQYNVQLAPDGTSAPWLMIDTQPEIRHKASDAKTEIATPFPLDIPHV